MKKQMDKKLKKKRTLIGSSILAAVVIVGGIVAYALTKNQSNDGVSGVTGSGTVNTVTTSPTPTPTPLQAPDVLTGQSVNADAAAQPVVGVMIENLYPDARPQSGLSQAGIVYEALAEGGITRFMALFQEPFPANIGPIRSLRPYYLEWGLEHDIPVVHAGGSQPALAEISPSGLKNIDALVYGAPYFYRSTDRVAPHNLYATATGLAAIDTKLGFATTPTFTPLPRKVDAPLATPTHATITINFSSSAYAVKYTYNATTNSYARFMDGTPHIDRNTNTQIFVKNVVVQYVSTTYGTQEDGKPETDYADVGSGKVLVFDDGSMTIGTWSKKSASAPTIFLDSTGQPIKFNVGNTWISAVPTGNSVTY